MAEHVSSLVISCECQVVKEATLCWYDDGGHWQLERGPSAGGVGLPCVRRVGGGRRHNSSVNVAPLQMQAMFVRSYPVSLFHQTHS